MAANKATHWFKTLKSEIRIPFELAVSECDDRRFENIATLDIRRHEMGDVQNNITTICVLLG